MELKTTKKQMKEIKETCRGRGSEYNKRQNRYQRQRQRQNDRSSKGSARVEPL